MALPYSRVTHPVGWAAVLGQCNTNVACCFWNDTIPGRGNVRLRVPVGQLFSEPEIRRAGRCGLIHPQRSTLRGDEPRDQLDACAVGLKRVYLAPLEPSVTGIVYRRLTVLVIPSDRARSERDGHHAGMRVPAVVSGIAEGCDLR